MSRSPQIPDSREAAPLRHDTPAERRGVEDITLAASRVSDNQGAPGTVDSQERELHPKKPKLDRIRDEYRGRHRSYRLHDSEIITLVQIGVFRAVNKDDLAQYAYAGDQARMESDLRNLSQQSLIERHTLVGFKGDTPTLVTLTRDGQTFVRHSRALPTDQATYHGFRKPKEARHDAELYRLYQNVASEIVSKGGKNLRVSLDYELKKQLYRDLATLGQKKDDPDRKAEIAARHGLRVVANKIPIPDMRIEYDTSDLDRAKVDLELATSHYRPRHMAEKAHAGFTLYGRSEDVARLRRILDDREITAEILSL
jgi:hypothetical protein